MLRMMIVALALMSGQAWAGDALPYSALKPYAEFRAEIIKAGWLPMDRKNDVSSYRPAIDAFPEMDCNLSDLCFARFSPPSNWPRSEQEVVFVVSYYPDDPQKFRLSPQF